MVDYNSYKIFVNQSPNALAMFDTEMRFLSVSEVWLEDYGLGDQDIIGESYYDIFPEAENEWKSIHDKCLSGAIMHGDEALIQQKGISEQWIAWDIRPWYLSDETIGGLLIYTRNITERKKAEEELKTTTQRLLLATEGSKLGIWDQDIINNRLVWDEGMFRLYGISGKSFGGTFESWIQHVHFEDRPKIEKMANAVMKGEADFDVEFRIVWPDLSIRHIRALALLQRDKDGQPVRLVGTNLDITSSKKYEETLEQISFDISHVIRRPISSLLGLTTVIESENMDEEKLREYSSHIKIVAKELDDFTRRLNDVYYKKKIEITGSRGT